MRRLLRITTFWLPLAMLAVLLPIWGVSLPYEVCYAHYFDDKAQIGGADWKIAVEDGVLAFQANCFPSEQGLVKPDGNENTSVLIPMFSRRDLVENAQACLLRSRPSLASDSGLTWLRSRSRTYGIRWPKLHRDAPLPNRLVMSHHSCSGCVHMGFGDFGRNDYAKRVPRVLSASIPIPPLLVMAAIPLAVIGYRRYKATPPGHCPSCGYDLRGSAGNVCSECGEPIARAAAQKPEAADEKPKV